MIQKFLIYLKAIRVWQWPKNLVVFTLPIGSGIMEFQILISSLWAFFGLSLISSSIYLLNDINDIDIDITHHTKKNRPIALGLVPIQSAKILSYLLLLSSLFIFSSFNFISLGLGCFYFLLGLMYTLKIKYIAYLDMLTISCLFLTRVLIGGYSVKINPSIVLLLFIFFFSLSLALSKRITIIKDERLSIDSSYKKFLLLSYNSKKINNILKLTLFLTFITYIFWVFFVNINEFSTFGTFFSIMSIFFLGRSLLGIYRLTSISQLEDFLVSLFQNKKELTFIFLATLSSLFSIYLA